MMNLYLGETLKFKLLFRIINPVLFTKKSSDVGTLIEIFITIIIVRKKSEAVGWAEALLKFWLLSLKI